LKIPSNKRRKRATYGKNVKILGKPYTKVCNKCNGKKCEICYFEGTVKVINIACDNCNGTGKVIKGTNFPKTELKYYKSNTIKRYQYSSECFMCDGKGSSIGYYYI